MHESSAHRDRWMHFWWCNYCKIELCWRVIVCFDGLSRHLEACWHCKWMTFDLLRQFYAVDPCTVVSKLPVLVGFDPYSLAVACKSLFHAFCMRKSLLWQDQLHHYSLNIIALCALQWVGSISWKKEAYWKWWVFGNCPFLHVRIMMDFAGSTGPFSTGLSLPAFNDLIEANGLCPVWFRLKLMKWEAFSVSMDIVAQWHGSFFSGPAHGSNACTSLLFSLAYIK